MANTTLSQLWVISPLKEKIIIGRHSLESTGVGSSHLGRYKDYTTGRYDGVHLYGRTGVRDYTNSVKSILLIALPDEKPAQTSVGSGSGFGNKEAEEHLACEQALYQWRQAESKRTHKQTNGKAQHKKGEQSKKGAQFNQSVPTQNRFNFFNQGN